MVEAAISKPVGVSQSSGPELLGVSVSQGDSDLSGSKLAGIGEKKSKVMLAPRGAGAKSPTTSMKIAGNDDKISDTKVKGDIGSKRWAIVDFFLQRFANADKGAVATLAGCAMVGGFLAGGFLGTIASGGIFAVPAAVVGGVAGGTAGFLLGLFLYGMNKGSTQGADAKSPEVGQYVGSYKPVQYL